MTPEWPHVHEETLAGYTAVRIENETISVTVLPGKGGDIHALFYKPRSVDVLWKAPWDYEKPSAPTGAAHGSSEVAWMDCYAGGWQGIFPNGGDACQYNGAALGFHGEASAVPWRYTLRRDSGGATLDMTVRLRRSPFLLRRSIAVDAARPALSIEEQVTNEGKQALHYMWGHHPAFGAPFLGEDCIIHLPQCIYRADDAPLETCRVERAKSGAWPLLCDAQGNTVDLSRVPGPESGLCEFGYLCDLKQGWYALSSPLNKMGFRLTWPLDVFPYLWLWQELGGSTGYPWYGRCYVMALEPFTSIPGYGLVRAIERGTAPLLQAGQTVSAQLTADLYEEGDGRIIQAAIPAGPSQASKETE